MRLKLVIITSLLAALVGAGGSIAIILGIFSSLKSLRTPGPAVVATLLLPIVTVLAASFFVYRHTARRRKLQAFLTAMLATFLSLCLFLLASIVTAPRQPIQLPQPAGPSTTN
jgi:cytochrome bd-type quinol oxidase subunit 2